MYAFENVWTERVEEDWKNYKLNREISVCKTILESNIELDFRQFRILRSIDSRTRRFQESHLVSFSGFLPFRRHVDDLVVDIKYSGAWIHWRTVISDRYLLAAYKHADGKKIDGRRVLVDVERARTVKGWLPRKLGGGLGGTRRGGPDVNIKHSGREDNERERERYRLERERETSGRGLDRDRDRDRLDRERRRSRERKRRTRSRSRDRNKRRRSRDRLPDPDIEEIERPRDGRDRRDRDRDRDRDRKRRRSRSNDRDRGDRDRKRDKRERDRDRRDRKDRGDRQDEDTKEIRIKEEPLDDYPDYSNTFATSGSYFTAVKYEDDNDQEVEEKYRIPEGRPDPPPYNNYDSVQDYWSQTVHVFVVSIFFSQ